MQMNSIGNEAIIFYNELTPQLFQNKINEYGCVLIKNLFPAAEIAAIQKDTLDLFYIIKNLQHNNLINEANQKYLGGGHPAGILPSLATLENVLNKIKFIEALQQYFKHNEFVVNVESTGIRRCDPHQWKNYLPWHQDIFDRGDAFITCWLPLMKIDEHTPGLDLVPKKVRKKLGQQDGLDVAYNGKGLADDLIDTTITKARWRPAMAVGDVLIFDPYCPHRTSYDEKFSIERYSIDIRIHPKNFLPEASWKTCIINLPAKNADDKQANNEERSLFDFRHLLDIPLMPVATRQSAKLPISHVSKMKKVVKRIKENFFG